MRTIFVGCGAMYASVLRFELWSVRVVVVHMRLCLFFPSFFGFELGFVSCRVVVGLLCGSINVMYYLTFWPGIRLTGN